MEKIVDGIEKICIHDTKIDLFEGIYIVPDGVTYNSYVVKGDRTAVLDTVDAHYGNEWLAELEKALGGRAPDYLVVSHMEPDHSANIRAFMDKYPTTKIVGNAKTFAMIAAYFGTDYADRREVVTDGATLELGGGHALTFVFAPMVHWPEVMLAYDAPTGTLFSADAFGRFGGADESEPWDAEARRYYIGIVGKYGMQVQNLLKKLPALNVKRICPLHGPTLTTGLDRYVGLYDTWSSYRPETDGVMIAFSSVYGHTAAAAAELEAMLKARGVDVVRYDLVRTDHALCVAEAFRYSRLVLATTTYNMEIFPAMREFLDALTERGYRGRRVGIIENGSWAPNAAKCIRAKLEQSKDLTVIEPAVTVKSALNAESRAALEKLAEEI